MSDERKYIMVQYNGDQPMAYMCASRGAGVFGPWTGTREHADRFTKAEAERASKEWNEAAAREGVSYTFKAEEA